MVAEGVSGACACSRLAALRPLVTVRCWLGNEANLLASLKRNLAPRARDLNDAAPRASRERSPSTCVDPLLAARRTSGMRPAGAGALGRRGANVAVSRFVAFSCWRGRFASSL